jgi:transposase
MRGADVSQTRLLVNFSTSSLVPEKHPLRPIREMVNQVLKELSPEFNRHYSVMGRRSIPPEQIFRALIIQILYSIGSERLLMEQIQYNMLFRWFIGLSVDQPVWNHSVYSKHRDDILSSNVTGQFFTHVRERAKEAGLLSDEHFTVDGTLLEAWASLKSVHPKNQEPPPPGPGRNSWHDFKGEKRTNETHASVSDPESRLYTKSKGQAAKLSYMGHVLMENRNGLIQDVRVTQADGYAEREAALSMTAELPKPKKKGRDITIGADKGYDSTDFLLALLRQHKLPHVAAKEDNSLAAAFTCHHGYAASQKVRKRVEEIFGWMKTIGSMKKLKHRSKEKVGSIFRLTAIAYNLVRMRNLGVAAV